MTFEKDKICHPLNVEEARKYENKKGWFADSIEELKKIIETRDTGRFGQMKIFDQSLELPYRLCNDYNVSFRYFYPAPEPEYRPYTDNEMLELVGKVVKQKNSASRSIITTSWVGIIIIGGAGCDAKELLETHEFPNGTPCGVEVTE